jgi:small-conductance mechanosensitive channel
VDELWTIAREHASWVIAIVVVLGAAVTGTLLRSFGLDRLAKLLEDRTKSTLDEDIVRSLRRPVVLWCTLAGFYCALLLLDLDPEVAELFIDVLSAVMIISITIWFAELLVRLMVAVVPSRPGRASPVTGVVQNVVRTFVMLVGLVLLLGNFGISVAPMLTTLGIGGLAVALGLQETLANVFAGMQLTIGRTIRVGDVLRLEEGEEAVLEDIGWRVVTMRRLWTNATVIVPNARLAHDVITNLDQPTSEIGVLVDFGVHYKSDLQQVEELTCEVATDVMKNVPGGVKDYEPFMRYEKFGPSAIEFTVHMRATGYRESLLVRHEFIKRLAMRYAAEGIIIPFPVQAINVDQENVAAALASIGTGRSSS